MNCNSVVVGDRSKSYTDYGWGLTWPITPFIGGLGGALAGATPFGPIMAVSAITISVVGGTTVASLFATMLPILLGFIAASAAIGLLVGCWQFANYKNFEDPIPEEMYQALQKVGVVSGKKLNVVGINEEGDAGEGCNSQSVYAKVARKVQAIEVHVMEDKAIESIALYFDNDNVKEEKDEEEELSDRSMQFTITSKGIESGYCHFSMDCRQFLKDNDLEYESKQKTILDLVQVIKLLKIESFNVKKAS